MDMKYLAVVLGVAGACSLYACTVTEGDGGGSGGTGATGGSGGSTSTGGNTNTGGDTSTGGNTNTGGSNTGGGGTGGAGECQTCSSYITFCNEEPAPPGCLDANGDPNFCTTGSAMIFDTLGTCLCNACANDCQLSCTGSGSDTADCGTCQQDAATGACSTEFGDCANDA